jgi:hypothetical protein
MLVPPQRFNSSQECSLTSDSVPFWLSVCQFNNVPSLRALFDEQLPRLLDAYAKTTSER